MGSSLRSIDIIDKCINAFVVSVVMLHRDFNEYFVLLAFKIEDVTVNGIAALIYVADKFLDSAFIMIGLFLLLLRPYIFKDYLQSLCKESHLAKPLLKN